MTATNARMTLVQIGDRPDDTMLLSEAEIAQLRAAFAARVSDAPAPDPLPIAAADQADLPDFTASDATILASQKRASAPRDPAASLNQRLIILIGGLIAALILLALSALSGSDRRIAPNLAPATAAVPTLAPTAVPTRPPSPSAAPESTVGAFFDYRDPGSSTSITATGILRVEGRAGEDWRLVALSAHRPVVWIRLVDLPAGVPVADPLPDLAPRPTAQPAPRQPTSGSGGNAGSGGEATTPAQCLTQADIHFTTERDVTRPNSNGTTDYIGHVHGQSCYSQAEADANADAQEQVVLAQRNANPVATPLPSATPMPLTQP